MHRYNDDEDRESDDDADDGDRTESDSVVASPLTVRDYLVREYDVTTEDVDAILAENIELVNTDADMRSYAYWTGDKIAKIAKLMPRDIKDVNS